jgi:HD-GYP domain-containing protein (c-di-GMP phosphodiesterase class II)
MLAALAQAIDTRDPGARGHALRVAALAEGLARTLGWEEPSLAPLVLGARLHDLGKLAVDPAVLRKTGPLDEHELEQIRLHPIAGARLVAPVRAARPALPCILFHHERWDGGGYPTGRAGHRIPAAARILAVADAYDAMTSMRPYRPTLTPEQALGEIERCAGTQFDPIIADAFLKASGAAPAAAAS